MVRHTATCLLTIALTLTLTLLALVQPTSAQNLSDNQLSLVKARLADGAKQSWELGTRAQALTESDTPSYSVLNNTSVPPPTSSAPASLDEVFNITKMVVANRSASNKGVTGPQPLIQDAAAGDPASLGVAVLLANWTGRAAMDGVDYAGAAKDQLDFLFENVPKTSDGAISHRTQQVQLWADFVYMVPPFLAYYGVLSENRTLIEEAYSQVKLYRQYLLDTSAGGLWKHILLGTGTDPGHWSTGNGWAAAGMLRVLGTIQNSQYANLFKSEQSDLISWVSEIQSGMYPHLQSSGLFTNYADDSSTFEDASSTALMASTVYRLALLADKHTHLPDAERSRKALSAPSNTTSSSNGAAPLAHFTADGWLTPVVNPDNFAMQGSQSPEGQAFVVEMQAAWSDWVRAGSPGASGAMERCTTGGVVCSVIAGIMVVLLGS